MDFAQIPSLPTLSGFAKQNQTLILPANQSGFFILKRIKIYPLIYYFNLEGD